MDIMDYFRFGPVCILAIFLNTILAMPSKAKKINFPFKTDTSYSAFLIILFLS